MRLFSWSSSSSVCFCENLNFYKCNLPTFFFIIPNPSSTHSYGLQKNYIECRNAKRLYKLILSYFYFPSNMALESPNTWTSGDQGKIKGTSGQSLRRVGKESAWNRASQGWRAEGEWWGMIWRTFKIDRVAVLELCWALLLFYFLIWYFDKFTYRWIFYIFYIFLISLKIYLSSVKLFDTLQKISQHKGVIGNVLSLRKSKLLVFLSHQLSPFFFNRHSSL